MTAQDSLVVAAPQAPYLLGADDVVSALGTDVTSGLSGAEAARRLAADGPNTIRSEAQPSMLRVALVQLRDPMNIMLLAVAVVSLAIGEVPTAILVAALVLLNLVLGTRQE